MLMTGHNNDLLTWTYFGVDDYYWKVFFSILLSFYAGMDKQPKKWRSCISLLSSQSNGWLFRKCTNYVWTKISRNLGILETINTAWQLLPNPNRNSFWQHLLFINLSNHVVLINWFNQINWTRLCISKMSFLLLPSRRLRTIWPCKNRRLNSIHRFPAREIHNNITNIQETFICLSRF